VKKKKKREKNRGKIDIGFWGAGLRVDPVLSPCLRISVSFFVSTTAPDKGKSSPMDAGFPFSRILVPGTLRAAVNNRCRSPAPHSLSRPARRVRAFNV
jgi:hypothetical protein